MRLPRVPHLLTVLVLSAIPLAASTPRAGGASLPPSDARVVLERDGHARIPFLVKTGHIWVRGRVGDSDSLWIVIDTGAAASVMDDSLARRLGLRVTGTHEAHGAGGSQEGSEVAGQPIFLPGLTVRLKHLDTVSLTAFGAASGQPMDFILGYELFHDCVVRFDYANGVLDAWDARHAPRNLPGVTVPMTLVQHHPYVEAEVTFPGRAPIRGKWVIDTGSALALSIAPEIVARESLAASLPRTIEAIGRGVGGEVRVRTGRADAFQLGALTFDQPIATLAAPGAGRISVVGSVGNIGGQILGRCRVTFDYRHQRVVFEPNERFAEPFEGEMSGATFVRAGPDFVVRLVNPGTPAAEAGLHEGDRVTSVDGRPAAEFDLAALRAHLTGAGRAVQVDVVRGDEHFRATLTLRRLI